MGAKLTATLQYFGDAYDGATDPNDINGRRLAGSSFMKGFLGNASSETVQLIAGDDSDLDAVRRMIAGAAPEKTVRVVERYNLDKLGDQSVIQSPGPSVEALAYQRLHFGQTAFSLCGLTHTTSGFRLPDPFLNLRTTPVEPWDGLICTAETVKTSLNYRFDAIDEYLRRRFGAPPPPRPQMPVIPLGINTDEFQVTAADRATLRAEIGAADGDIVVSTLARLSPHYKFDPFPIYLAMERAQRQTGRAMHLLFAGFFLGDYADTVFRSGAAQLAPNVKVHFRKADTHDARREALAGSDIFVFAIDSIQETFGLAPVEAMAAGLPVIASDWNGMKDTVTPDVGFRIPTRTVQGRHSKTEALLNEVGFDKTVPYMTLTSGMAEMSVPDFAEKLALLATDGDLRHSLGEAGKRRAAGVYDWSQVIPQYEAFWAELDAIRRAAGRADGARYKGMPSPVAPPVFDFFACYPTRQGFAADITFAAEADAEERLKLVYQARNYSTVKRSPLNLQAAGEMLRLIAGWEGEAGPTYRDLAAASSHTEEIVEKTLIWLLKYDLIASREQASTAKTAG